MHTAQEQAAALLACNLKLCGPEIECAERVAAGDAHDANMWSQLQTEFAAEIAAELDRKAAA